MRAVRFGRILVIDEADKAPLEVVIVLKGLAYPQTLIILSVFQRILGSGNTS